MVRPGVADFRAQHKVIDAVSDAISGLNETSHSDTEDEALIEAVIVLVNVALHTLVQLSQDISEINQTYKRRR